MKIFKYKFTYVIVLVIVGILAVTLVASADSDTPWPWSSGSESDLPSAIQVEEHGDAPDEGTGREVINKSTNENYPLSSEDGDVIGINNFLSTELQPDDNGYVGPEVEPQEIDMESGLDGEGMISPEQWPSLTAPQDDDNILAETLYDDGVRWSTDFSYIHVAGSTLRPRSSSVEWSSGGSGGCLYVSSGNSSTVFNIHLEIPDGVQINYLRMYYYDASSSTSYAWITRYDDTGGFVDVTSVTSSGDAGYGTSLSDLVTAYEVVDNVGYSYVLNWAPVVTGTSMQLCGFRVAYRTP